MEKYPKIETLLKRDTATFGVIDGEWCLPEFEYLKNNAWLFTEKIDGTNVRVAWLPKESGDFELRFGGRTDNAQMPTFLLSKLQDLFNEFDWATNFPDGIVLYGEGYGAKIQKGGGNYIANGVDFALFDIKIGDWWLKRNDVEGIANNLSIKCVPIVGEGTLKEAIKFMCDGLQSTYGSFPMEGLVVKPKVDLFARNGQRLIGKIKTGDFK